MKKVFFSKTKKLFVSCLELMNQEKNDIVFLVHTDNCLFNTYSSHLYMFFFELEIHTVDVIIF